MGVSISRRAVLAGAASIVPVPTIAAPEVVAAMAALKDRLRNGKDATLLIIGDSTAYSEFGPYFQFGAVLGAEIGCKVVLHRWAEWESWQPSGPKVYAVPKVVHPGSGPTLEMFLAALPGGVAGGMFDGSRRAAAIDSIPTPHAVLWHHGHNHRSFEQPIPNEYGLGAGHFLGSIGLVSMKWPEVPQAIVIQNPWRDTDGYQKVRGALLQACASVEGLGVIDGFTPFVDRRKALSLYRDNIHPSDREDNARGAALTKDVLMAAYRAADPSAIGRTASWPAARGINLLDNGNFQNWRGAAPLGWKLEGSLVVTRDSKAILGGSTYSLAMTPDVSQTSALTKVLSPVEMARVRGKRLTLAILVKAAVSQPPPFGIFVTPLGPRGGTFAFGGGLAGVREGWSWLVAADIPVEATAAVGSTYLKLYPAWGGKMPLSVAPVSVQKIVLVEGRAPKGLL